MAMDKRHGDMGMSMGMGMFKDTDMTIARALWYIVAATAAVRGSRMVIDLTITRLAKRKFTTRDAVPSRPTGFISQAYCTLLATCREMTYPARKPSTGSISRYFSLPTLGQGLILLTYWTIILIMLWSNTILTPSSSMYAYKWEKVGFRAAWVSVTQLPLIYALSCKFNIISIVTGVSYERLNWLHRWVSRTVFLTVIVHWAYFFTEWSIADFVKYQLKIMPMVKYGFGAWAVLSWSVLTGFGFFRAKIYEIWLLQHLASAGVLLWLLHIHVPSYAQYNIWLAVGFVAFDRVVRGGWSLVNNLHLTTLGSRSATVGFRSEVTVLSNNYIRLTIKDVDLSWRAGQHVYLSVPVCGGIFESHPFTIASPARSRSSSPRDLEIYLKVHNGFTRRLLKRAQKHPDIMYSPRAFISGPWGIPPLPAIERANSLVFISSSTGASFIVPLLEHAVLQAPFVQRIAFHWIIRHESQLEWFRPRIQKALDALSKMGLESVECTIYITGGQGSMALLDGKATTSSSSIEAASTCSAEKAGVSDKEHVATTSLSTTSSTSDPSRSICYKTTRPSTFDPLIRPTVEAASGETVIVACGGRQLIAQVRAYTGSLSDERAVHKGTGAQGIYLFAESYGW